MADFISQLSGPEMDNALQEVNAHNAEAWSSGTRGGVQVASGDPTYDNNAKYWAQVAKSAVPPGSAGAVLFSQAQQLSDSAKQVARTNIGASGVVPIVNLLNPTMATTTIGTVTCTNNGDGTYTVNGTNNTGSPINFRLVTDSEIKALLSRYKGKTLRVVGTPNVSNNYRLIGQGFVTDGIGLEDKGNGFTFTVPNNIDTYATVNFRICIPNGAVLNNVVFRPMITENLSATYDDFIEYGHYIQDTGWITTSYYSYRKYGKTVYLKRNLSPTVAVNTNVTLGTLPGGYRPQSTCIFPIIWWDGANAKMAEVTVNSNGAVTLHTQVQNYVPAFHISFIVD